MPASSGIVPAAKNNSGAIASAHSAPLPTASSVNTPSACVAIQMAAVPDRARRSNGEVCRLTKSLSRSLKRQAGYAEQPCTGCVQHAAPDQVSVEVGQQQVAEGSAERGKAENGEQQTPGDADAKRHESAEGLPQRKIGRPGAPL